MSFGVGVVSAGLGFELLIPHNTCTCPYRQFFRARFPQFAEAHPLAVTLEPGDVLFVPKHWWHFVEAIDTSLSVNVWVDAPNDSEDRAKESVARVIMTSLASGLDAEVCVTARGRAPVHKIVSTSFPLFWDTTGDHTGPHGESLPLNTLAIFLFHFVVMPRTSTCFCVQVGSGWLNPTEEAVWPLEETLAVASLAFQGLNAHPEEESSDHGACPCRYSSGSTSRLENQPY